MITNAGGPGVIAADTLAAEGGQMAKLSPESLKKLNALLLDNWRPNNPVDVLRDADADCYTKAVEIVAAVASRPYPRQYVSNRSLKDGTALTIRPIRPEDEPLMVKFHSTLSEETVHFRYFGLPRLDQRVTHERLTRICFNDYDREITLVA